MSLGSRIAWRSILNFAKIACPTAAVTMFAFGCGTAASREPKPGVLGPPKAPIACTRYAAPSGDDRAPGTARRPYRSAQRLVDALQAGGTGCLEPGVYRENVAIRRGGSPGKPVTLTSADGRGALLRGSLFIPQSAAYVTVSNMALNGDVGGASSPPSPQVNGDYVRFDNVDITNDHTGICVVIGGAARTYGIPRGTSIVYSRIHDCGRLPATGFEHGIYVAHSRGAVISDNYIYDNADWGIHLYPDAMGSVISHNIIDGNGSGVIIAGTRDSASSNNYISHNVISNSRKG